MKEKNIKINNILQNYQKKLNNTQFEGKIFYEEKGTKYIIGYFTSKGFGNTYGLTVVQYENNDMTYLNKNSLFLHRNKRYIIQEITTKLQPLLNIPDLKCWEDISKTTTNIAIFLCTSEEPILIEKE